MFHIKDISWMTCYGNLANISCSVCSWNL